MSLKQCNGLSMNVLEKEDFQLARVAIGIKSCSDLPDNFDFDDFVNDGFEKLLKNRITPTLE